MGKNRIKKAVDPSPRPDQQRGNAKKKTNSAPKDLDMQEIPFKLREIMRSRAEMNKPKHKKKKKKKVIGSYLPLNDEIRTTIPIPKFKKNKRESVGAYLERMDRAVKHVMFLSKNQPDLQPEEEVTEEAKVKESPESSAPQEKPQKKDHFYRRKEDKAMKKKEEKEASRLEKDLFKDKVEFGEVAMEPPQITAKPRKSSANTKPGQKSLLLKKMFENGGASSKPSTISMARKRVIEEERERVIEAYRQMKKRKQQQDAKTDF
uniref:Coiled-coil domain containing 137 n=1 Tax=Leptobrachium leishanense TaxID=445787 RepID=A0A8C5R620_9ANUR